MLDMLRPWIDERHVLARLHHMGAGISADGTRSDNDDLPPHAFLRASWALRLARRPGSSQWLKGAAPGVRGASVGPGDVFDPKILEENTV
jgi:hypothetical protein